MKRTRKGSPAWAKYKNRKRLLRQGLQYVPDSDYALMVRDRNKVFLTAPKNFSLLTNTSLIVEYFQSVRENANAQIPTVMDMSSIQTTDLATISLLIAVMMDKRKMARKIKQHVTVYVPPANTRAGQLFHKAQFRETVTAKGIADHTFFLSRQSKKVNKEYIADVLRYTEKFLGVKNPSRLSPLLVEILSNTNNHANPNATEESDILPWFLSVMEDTVNRKIIFSVVDLGVGIFESLRLKGLAQADKYEESFKSVYKNSQTNFLRANIPKGVDSSTGLFYRGKGLKSIYEYAKDKKYGKFNIITNRAIINLKNISEANIDTGDSFDGTIYYWEMS